MRDLIGQQFENYRLIRLLGHGGFAEVYLGIHSIRNTPVAVKVLYEPLDQEDLPAFLGEVRNLLRLRHPSIVPLLDFNQQHIPPFIVMGYAPNGTLRQRHPAGSILPPQTIITYINQLALALQYAHDEKIIHRDVKPQNMLLGANNEVLLSDFGIATVAHSMRSINTNKQMIAGTAAYMAPEQFQGKPCPASDQYALGVVAYEWLCGKLPFEGTFYALYHQHLNTTPPPLHERTPAISPSIEQVVLKALAKQPGERHANLLAFTQAFEQAILVSQQASQRSFSMRSLPKLVQQQADFPAESLRPGPQIGIEQPPTPPFAGTGKAEPQTSEDVDSQTAHTEQKKNRTPPLESFEQLWREAVQAQARGENEQAFRLLRKITTLPRLTPSQKETVKTQIRSFRQMIPLCLQQAQEAVVQGRWQDEIRAWEDILALEPSEQEITQQITLQAKGPIREHIQERLRIARQNKHCTWMYNEARRFMREQDSTAARAQLEILWKNAPMYGDPVGLAQLLGLPPTDNYEQALVKEQARLQRERDEAEQKRQQQEAAQRKRKEEAEQERQRQEEEKRKKQRKKALITSVVAGGAACTVAGGLGGLLLSLIAIGGTSKTALVFPVASAIGIFLSAITHIAGSTAVTWAILLGALIGLGLEEAITVAIFRKRQDDDGLNAALIVAIALGMVVGACFGGMNSGIWGVIVTIIASVGGAINGVFVLMVIGGPISAIIDRIL